MIFTLPIKMAIGVGSTGVVLATGGAVYLSGVFGPEGTKDTQVSKDKYKEAEVPAPTYEYVYGVVVTAETPQPSTDIVMGTAGSNTKNYQCEMDGQKFDCTITALDLTETKKLNEMAAFSVESATTIDKTILETAKKIYKISAAESIHLKDWSQEKTIEIISKDTTETNKYASITPIFATTKTTSTETAAKAIGKTEYFLAKSGSELTEVTTTTTLTCSFEKLGSTPESCKIYEFEEDSYGADKLLNGSLADLTFKAAPGATATKIAKDRYYVIEITDKPQDISYDSFDITVKHSTSDTVTLQKIKSLGLWGEKTYMFAF